MKLLTKLLLGIGWIFLIMAGLLYLLAVFFFRGDVRETTEEVERVLKMGHEQLLANQHVLLSNVLDDYKQNVNAVLLLVYEKKDLVNQLTFGPDKPWRALVQLASDDPDIALLQLHSPSEGQAALLNIHDVSIYPVFDFYRENGQIFVSLLPSTHVHPEKYLFAAIPITDTSGHSLYALLQPQATTEQLEKVRRKIVQLSSEDFEKRVREIQSLELSPHKEPQRAFRWKEKMTMIQKLMPLFVEGITVDKEDRKVEGLVSVDPKGNAVAILTKDVFLTSPIFNDEAYFDHYPPEAGIPLANGTVFVHDFNGEHVYLANTLQLNSTFLSIGHALGPLLRDLVFASNEGILMGSKKRGFWIGFDEYGNKLNSNQLNQIKQWIPKIEKEKRKMIVLDGKEYSFASIGSYQDLVFYNFVLWETSITKILYQLEENLLNKLFIQLLLVSLASMVLILIFIGRFGFKVVYPIVQLAEVTKDIAAGHYEEISIPKMGKRRDEVAILARSFDAMVTGLREREKIRDILNKVVSKEIAEEILKKQIRLGGEDRIVSMLFGDIRDFSQLTQDFSSQKTIEMLNTCMTKISRIIEGEGGIIDKYVGDEVMAIYGAPTHCPDHALRAVSSGMLLIKTLKQWNIERSKVGEKPVEMGVGVHTGSVVAGNMGAENRLNYTILGSNVNLASRLCSVAKPNQLIISKDVLAEPRIKESFYFQPLPPIALKGIVEAVHVYEITGFKWE